MPKQQGSLRPEPGLVGKHHLLTWPSLACSPASACCEEEGGLEGWAWRLLILLFTVVTLS